MRPERVVVEGLAARRAESAGPSLEVVEVRPACRARRPRPEVLARAIERPERLDVGDQASATLRAPLARGGVVRVRHPEAVDRVVAGTVRPEVDVEFDPRA